MCSLVKFKLVSLLKIFKWSVITNYIMSRFPVSKAHMLSPPHWGPASFTSPLFLKLNINLPFAKKNAQQISKF